MQAVRQCEAFAITPLILSAVGEQTYTCKKSRWKGSVLVLSAVWPLLLQEMRSHSETEHTKDDVKQKGLVSCKKKKKTVKLSFLKIATLEDVFLKLQLHSPKVVCLWMKSQTAQKKPEGLVLVDWCLPAPVSLLWCFKLE